jgi:hypothetical protein
MPTSIPERSIPFYAALDNYEPVPRRDGRGSLIEHVKANGAKVYRIADAELLFGSDAYRAVYLLDDGHTVIAHYVIGYWAKDADTRAAMPELAYPGSVLISPFPVNPNGERTTNGVLIDFTDWTLGPRRAFHLKITRES